MTNKEKYKQAFSVLQTSDDFSMEVEKMAMRQKHHKMKTIAAAVAACVILVGGAGTAYAADVGGVQRTIQLWIDGDRTNATFEIKADGDIIIHNDDGNNTSYIIKSNDEEGNTTDMGGDSVATEEDGGKGSPVEEEAKEQNDQPKVEYKDDGSVWVCYKDQKLDITDRFEDGICYVKLIDGEDNLYLTAKYKDGYGVSSSKYLSPQECN